MKLEVREGDALPFITSRTPSIRDCVRRNAGRRGDWRASSRGAAVPKGANSCHGARRYPGATQVSTKRLFIESEGSLRRASVLNDLVSGVADAGRPLHGRACPLHKVLRFRQAGHCSSPRLFRTGRDLLHGGPWQAARAVREPTVSVGRPSRDGPPPRDPGGRPSSPRLFAAGGARAARGRALPTVSPLPEAGEGASR